MTTPQGYSLAAAVQDPLLLTISMSSAILSTSPLLLLSALLMTPAFAQQMVAPVPATKSEYTSVNDKALYIRGGYNSGSPVQQFYSLDLTPLLAHSNKLFWKYLNPGGPIQKFQTKMPMAVLNNNQKLTYFNENGMMADYNLQSDRWDDSAKPICPATFKEGVKALQTALVDPKTNLVYIPFGTQRQAQMLVHDTSTSETKCSGVPMPTNSEGYLFAWSDSKSTIYMLGNIKSATKPILWEFQFATKTWKEISMNGSPPAAILSRSCLVSAFGGQKLLLFGGHKLQLLGESLATGDMYVFDTISYNWTKAATSPNGRTEMTCASAGEYFIAWGGQATDLTEIYPSEILFYNIKNNKWLNQTDIIPPSNTTTTSITVPVSTTSTGSESINTGLPPSKNNGAVIGGGIAAGVVAIAAIVGFILLRRHRNTKKRRDPQDLNLDSQSFSDPSNASLACLDAKMDSNAFLAPATAILDRDSNIKAEVEEGEWKGGNHPTQQGPQFQPPPALGGAANLFQQNQLPVPVALSPQYHSTDSSQEQLWPQQPLNSPHSPPLQPPLSPLMLWQEERSRSTHVQYNEVPADPLEQIALIQAKYDQDMEQMRRDQEAALERIRQQWQEDMAAKALREPGSEP